MNKALPPSPSFFFAFIFKPTPTPHPRHPSHARKHVHVCVVPHRPSKTHLPLPFFLFLVFLSSSFACYTSTHCRCCRCCRCVTRCSAVGQAPASRFASLSPLASPSTLHVWRERSPAVDVDHRARAARGVAVAVHVPAGSSQGRGGSSQGRNGRAVDAAQ